MALISLRQLLDHAAEHGYGVPAFNINNMEQVLAIMEAADAVNSPVILQASRGARSYAGDIMIRHMVAAAMEMFPKIPVVLHQDHGNNSATCVSAMQQGFSSVMMDGSLEADAKTPASYDYNVGITSSVTQIAHEIGVSVEGELGCLGSLETGTGDKEDGHGFEGKLEKDKLLTDPEQAVDFVTRTKVDALAVAIGTSHGAYKFSRAPTGDILADLRRARGRDRRRHPSRCSQGEYRYGLPHGDHGADAQGRSREARGVRSPQIPAPGMGCDA